MVYERTVIAPIWQLGFINGVGRASVQSVWPDHRFRLHRLEDITPAT
jgi:hypothetical protein